MAEDDEVHTILLNELGRYLPERAVALTDDFEHDLRLDSDDGTMIVMDLEKRFGVDLPQSRLYGVRTVGDLANLFIEFRKRKENPALDKELGEAERAWIDGGPVRPARPLSLLERIERVLGILGIAFGVVFLCAALFLFVETGFAQRGSWIVAFLAVMAFVNSAALLARK